VLDGVATLSSWGKLIWNKSKAELLAQELVDFSPHLVYAPSFLKDFQNIRMSGERVKLQETLARAAGLLWESGGNVAPLKADGGLLYEVYINQGGIGHFRVNQGLRVSCVGTSQGLELRHYGAHDYVNDNP
jgi:hypothetical protein